MAWVSLLTVRHAENTFYFFTLVLAGMPRLTSNGFLLGSGHYLPTMACSSPAVIANELASETLSAMPSPGFITVVSSIALCVFSVTTVVSHSQNLPLASLPVASSNAILPSSDYFAEFVRLRLTSVSLGTLSPAKTLACLSLDSVAT